MVERRTRSAKVFATDDEDRVEIAVFSRPVHFLDGDGSWKEIDPALVLTADGGFHNTAHEFDIEIAATHQDPVLGELGFTDGTSVGFGFADAQPGVGAPGHDRVVYREIVPEVDYHTARLVAQRLYGANPNTIVVTTGDNWPDAVVAGTLGALRPGGMAGMPLLLTPTDTVALGRPLHPQTDGYLDTHPSVNAAFLTGGPASVRHSSFLHLEGRLP